MSKKFASIEPQHRDFISRQHVFFVASATASGHINVSPKGLDAFRVLSPNAVAYLDRTGSGSETVTRAAYKARLAEFQRVLTRVMTTIDDRVVDGDRVWTRATSRGLNRETGELTVMTWLLVQRMESGRIAEQWVATFPGVDWTSGR